MGTHVNKPEFITPAPGDYDIPSKMVEKHGHAMGLKLDGAIYKKCNIPGPG